MENFKVSKKTWHWKIWDFFNYGVPKNFCDYFWGIVLNMICSLCWIYIIFNLIFNFYDYWYIILSSIAIVALCFGAIWLKRKLFNKNDKLKENKDGFFKTKIKSWKGKYCPGIEIIE